ncbi:MAG TPA: hypothetical protein VIR31_01565 [Nitrososphaeraceae archaeon]
MYKGSYYYYLAAGATTGIAGILHLILASNIISRNLNSGMFFILAGMTQLFWILPMVKQWGKFWYYLGIGGTIVLIILYVITRVPNPITAGRAFSINEMGIATIMLEAAYIGITALIILRVKREQINQREEIS